MQKVKTFKCPSCHKEYNSLTTWSNHVQKMHPEIIPKGFSAARYFYYLQTGKDHGSCVICHRDTKFNEATNKYERFCGDLKCKDQYREMFKTRMISKYGKVHLLDDPEKQREMLMKKKNSGMYNFPDGTKVGYASSYEKHFLEMLDKLLHFSGNDIMGPSPHTYYYEYKNPNDKEHEGKHFYIPDFYIPSINLEIEIKQNTNTHPKLLKIDHVKELQKDAMMNEASGVNYIKIVEKQYDGFFDLLLSLKNSVPKVNKSAKVTQGPVIESVDMLAMNDAQLVQGPQIDDDNYNIETVPKGEEVPEDPRWDGDMKNEPKKEIPLKEIDEKKEESPMKKEENKALNVTTDDVTLEFRGASRRYIRKITDIIDKFYDATVEDAAIEAANYSTENKYPVFIILSTGHTPLSHMITGVTGDEFTHATLSFDISLNPMYSFGTKKIDAMDLGFVKSYPKDRLWKMDENSKPVAYSLFVTYVNKEQLEKMKNRLQLFLDHGDKMKYYFAGLVRNFLHIKSTSQAKWFCSEFVADIINAGKTLDKHPSLYRPQQLKDVSDVEFVISGKDITEYDVGAASRALTIVKRRKPNIDTATEAEIGQIDDAHLDLIMKMNYKLSNYRYGYITPYGEYVDDFEVSHRLYKTIDPKTMDKHKVGICWDYVNYHKAVLEDKGYRPLTIFFQILNTPDKTTHTITLIPKKRPVYIESAYKEYAGIYQADTVFDIFSFVIKEMMDCANMTDYPQIEIRNITKIPLNELYGLSPSEYVDKVYKDGTNITNFSFNPTPHVDILYKPEIKNKGEVDITEIKNAMKEAHETFAALESSLSKY